MRVVLIRSNPIRPDSRVEKEVYSLKKAHHDVKVLCWDRDSNHKPQCDFLQLGDEKVEIIRIGHIAEFGARFKSLKSYLLFQLNMVRWLIYHRKEYDAVHACDFDTAFFSQIAKVLFGKLFIFDIFDYIYLKPSNLFGLCIKRLEDNIISKADATIICSEERIKQLKDSFPKRVTIIHNSPASIYNTKDGISDTNNHARIKISYIGILQEGRLLHELGGFFESNSGDYEFHVGGFGLLENYFKDLSNRCNNIFYYGRTDYSTTLSIEANSDIMIAIYDPKVPNHLFAAPNKFYESLFLGKPLIMVKNTGMSNYVKKYHIGSLMEDFSILSFENSLKEICAQKDRWGRIGNISKKLYKYRFSWDIMSERLVKLYDELETSLHCESSNE